MAGESGSGRWMRLSVIVMLAVGFVGGYYTGQRSSKDVPLSLVRDGCEHLDGSRWECPDSLKNLRLFSSGMEIERASLVVTTSSGSREAIEVSGGTDAIFLTPGGLEILLEHYRATDEAKATAVAQYLDWARRQP